MRCRPPHQLRTLPRLSGVVIAGVLGACDGATTPAPTRIDVAPHAILFLEADQAQPLQAVVRNAQGGVVPGMAVTWSTDDPAVVAVDPATGLARAMGPGRTRIRARSGDLEGSATAEFYRAPVNPVVPGSWTHGRESYVAVLGGTLPLVLSAPHGGSLEPGEIALRSWGVLGPDRNTQQMAEAIVDAIHTRTGGWPHVVINQLHRNRLDANREIVEAAQADPFAEWAWTEYQAQVDSARERVAATWGRGLFVDLHGHGHPVNRVELGYLLSADELALPDSILNARGLAAGSSLASLASESALDFAELVRGPRSMGALLQGSGYRAVPSPQDPDPGGEPYFTGGYNTRRHGSQEGGATDGIQFELPFAGTRDTPAAQAEFARVFAAAVERYLLEHYGLDWTQPSPVGPGPGLARPLGPG